MTNYDWLIHQMPGDMARTICTRDLKDAATYAFCRNCRKERIANGERCLLDQGKDCDHKDEDIVKWWLNQEYNQKEG